MLTRVRVNVGILTRVRVNVGMLTRVRLNVSITSNIYLQPADIVSSRFDASTTSTQSRICVLVLEKKLQT
jgi:hypothetical protein